MLKRNWRTIVIFIALLTDTFALTVSAFLAYFLRGFFPNLSPYSIAVFIQFSTFLGLSMIVSGLIIGVYRVTLHSNTKRLYFLASKSYLYSVLILFSILFFFQYSNFPRMFTIIYFLVLPVLFVFSRMLLKIFLRSMQQRGYGNHHVLLAGYEQESMSVVQRFKKFPEMGYMIQGLIVQQAQKSFRNIKINGSPIPTYPLSEIQDIVETCKVDRVFIPSIETMTNGYSAIFKICQKKQIKLKVLSENSDSLLSLSRVYDMAGITIYSPERTRIDMAKYVLKRLFDIVFAVIALILLSPMLFVTAAAILIESGMPILFKQLRAAIRGGEMFSFYKFRSMVKDADALKESLFEKNESDGALFKMKNDPRMTKVGKIIRKLSIDELPQLMNVIKGEMSIVGPRPLPVFDLEKLKESKDYWNSIKVREKVKPGITGLWQISGRSALGFHDMIWLDLYYIENQSLIFDLEIIFATIPVVLFGKGAY